MKTIQQAALPDLEEMAGHANEAAALLKSLAHPARLLVLCRLVDGEASVSELQAVGTLSMSALSQHLSVLREAGLVTTRREAQTIYYALADSPALGVMRALHEAYCGRAKSRGGQE
jgi:DNA-binding transcriptional ArsR family regulator